jgi:Fe-S cluster assembly protein SufD
MANKNEQIQPYLEQFSTFEQSLNGASKTPVHTLRKNAIAALSEIGFPTIKQEDWRYTSLSSLFKNNFVPATAVDRDTSKLSDDMRADFPLTSELVFVNGHYSKALSRLRGPDSEAVILSLAEAMESHAELVQQHLAKYMKADDNGFVALNTSFVQDGVFMYIPKGMQIEHPVHLIFLNSSNNEMVMTQPRILVVAEQGSSLKLIESHYSQSDSVYFTNVVMEVVAGDNAQVEHYKVQQDSEKAFHISNSYALLGRDTRFFSQSFTFGSKLARNNFSMGLYGEGGEGTINGLFMPHGKQHVDNHTVIDHAVPHCNSHETFKGLLDGESRGVFSGKIIVRQDAQKTDAKQSNNNILLSDKAVMDTKPQLEIFADDVRCTHGATIGRLDEKALFYLRTRGLNKEEAFNMLSYAFASKLVEAVSIEGLKEKLDKYIHNRLNEASH